MKGIKRFMSPIKNSKKKRNINRSPIVRKSSDISNTDSLGTTFSEEETSDHEQSSKMATSSKSTAVMIDPASFISCFTLALDEDVVRNKLIDTLMPLIQTQAKEIVNLKTELNTQRRKVADLESKLDSVAQWTRNDSIIISGIAFEKEETNNQCERKVISLATDIGVHITEADIQNIHRLQPQKNGNRNIIVRLASHKVKSDIMQHKKIYAETRKTSTSMKL